MRERFISILRAGLIIWGAISLIVLFAIVGLVLCKLGLSERAKTNSASIQDVRFVLNWCELGDQRIDQVLHSHASARSFTGDHLEAYAIKITHLEIAELTDPTKAKHGRWYRGDQLPQVVADAVAFAGGWLGELPWFPSKEQLRSSELFVYPWSIHCHGVAPSAVELIFVRPSDKTVFYFGGKT